MQRNRSDVVALKNNITDEVVEKEYEKLSEFLKFANLNNCFKDDKEVQIKLIELSDHTVIQINLVNSALLAFYKDKLKGLCSIGRTKTKSGRAETDKSKLNRKRVIELPEKVAAKHFKTE